MDISNVVMKGRTRNEDSSGKVREMRHHSR